MAHTGISLFLMLLLMKLEVSLTTDCRQLYESSDYNVANEPLRSEMVIELDYKVLNIPFVNEVENYFKLELVVSQEWYDGRINKTWALERDHRPVTGASIDCFWKPYLYMRELDDSRLHKEELPPTLYFMTPSLKVRYLTRYKLQVICRMDFSQYPVDVQTCRLEFTQLRKSGYRYVWNINTMFSAGSLQEHNVGSFSARISSNGSEPCVYNKKQICLFLRFKFVRKVTTALISIYFPSTLIVMMSFVSLWIDPLAVPGRVTLVVTSLLALVTQLLSVRQRMTPVSYVTALDIWFFSCLSLVSLCLFEFSLAYSAASRRPETPLVVTYNNRKYRASQTVTPKGLKWHNLDSMSRKLFPGVFITFTLVYITYLYFI